MLYYIIAFLPDAQEGFTLYSPDFPLPDLHAEDFVRGMQLVMASLKEALHTSLEAGHAVPAPCDMPTAQKRIETLAAERGLNPNDIFYRLVPVTVPDVPIQIKLNMSRSELAEMDTRAKELGLSRTELVNAAIKSYGG